MAILDIFSNKNQGKESMASRKDAKLKYQERLAKGLMQSRPGGVCLVAQQIMGHEDKMKAQQQK